MLADIQITPAQVATCQLGPEQIDCATAVMLKILDGKCKMPEHEKVLMEQLYDLTRTEPGKKLGNELHQLIQQARDERDGPGLGDAMRETVYEQRLYAETMISRPVMKAFKAQLRKQGVLPKKVKKADADDD